MTDTGAVTSDSAAAARPCRVKSFVTDQINAGPIDHGKDRSRESRR